MDSDIGTHDLQEREDENCVDLLNHCAICLTHFDSVHCKGGRVVLEGVSLKHLWSYFEVTCGEDKGGDDVKQRLKTWSFKDSMKTEMTTIPPLCLECSDIIFELNKRHQALMGAWKSFQFQLKLLQGLLTKEENIRRYKDFQETLELVEIEEPWKIKTRQFLYGIRKNETGFLHDALRSHLESWDKNEKTEVKEESLGDEGNDIIGNDTCEDERAVPDCNDIAAECDNASTVSNEGKSSELDSYPECVEVDDDSDDIDSDYEPSSDNIDTSEDEEELMDIGAVSHSHTGNTIVKRTNQEDIDPLAELSTPSTSKKIKINNTPTCTTGLAKVSPSPQVDFIDLTQEQTKVPKIDRSKRLPPPTYFEVAIKKCNLCDRFFATKDLKRHITSKHGKHPYTCDICGDNILPQEFKSHLEAHVGDYITKCCNPSCSYVAVNHQRLWKLHLSRRDEDEACKDTGMKYTEFHEKNPPKCECCTFTADSFSRLYTHVMEYHEAKSIEKSLSCPVATCDKKFAYRQTVERHLGDHVLNALILEEQHCKACNLYMAPDSLADHLKEFHKVAEVIKCEYCPYIFGERIHLLNHMCDVHVKTMDGVFCDICKRNSLPGYNYKIITDLRRHYFEVHHVGAPFVCEECSFTTYSKLSFDIHIRMNDHENYKHSQRKDLLTCEVCNEIFRNVTKHWKHMRDIHNDKRPKPVKKKKREYACECCDQIFDDYKVMIRHCRSAHPKTHVCESCGKICKTGGALTIHRKLHEGERPFVCEVCSHAFAQQGDLNSHMRIHTGERPYKCSICSESFRQRAGLRKHSLAVHKVDKTYVCSRDPSCGKSFTTYKELAHHEIREHENVCHLCTEERKEFETRKELKFHMRSRHRNTFSFKCEQCETLCASEAGLEVHCRQMHKL